MKYTLPLAMSLFISSTCYASEPGLPDDILVAQALDEHPVVIAALARVDSARAEAKALRAGTEEITLSGSYIKRSVELERTYNEFDVSVQRPFRLPGKAALDRKIGEFTVIAAENRQEDAKHQAALLLSTLWWDWLGASAEYSAAQGLVENLGRDLRAIERRVQLQDAAVLDADRARSALASAELTVEQTQVEMSTAQARLSAQFPALKIAMTAPELPQPVLPLEGFDRLHDKILGRSHEILAAQAEADRRSSMASRIAKNRTADPSFGFRVFSERDGAERGAGIVASIPIGGKHRSALADHAASEASAAFAELNYAKVNVQETADSDLAQAKYRMRAWQAASAALMHSQAALGRTRRGYELGAIDLSDLLAEQRLNKEANVAEIMARTEALRAIAKLRIDAHELWIGDDNDKP
jgi:outer membrane protein, heavy metal efflux system